MAEAPVRCFLPIYGVISRVFSELYLMLGVISRGFRLLPNITVDVV